MSETSTSPSRSWDFVIANTRGLHLRFAGEIARHAMKYQDTIHISNGRQSADAKSALALLSLAAPAGTRLTLEITGDQAGDALEDLKNFIENYTEK